MPLAQVSCQCEQIVTQAVDVTDGDGVLVGFGLDSGGAALGPAAYGTGHVGQRGGVGFARQDEGGLGRQFRRHAVDLALEEGGLGFVERFELERTAVVGQVGAHIHQMDLDAAQGQLLAGCLAAEQAQIADQFIEVPVGHHAGMRFADARPADEGGGAGVTGFRVDFHRVQFFRHEDRQFFRHGVRYLLRA